MLDENILLLISKNILLQNLIFSSLGFFVMNTQIILKYLERKRMLHLNEAHRTFQVQLGQIHLCQRCRQNSTGDGERIRVLYCRSERRAMFK